MSTNYEAAHYANFCALLFIFLSCVQTLLRIYHQTPSIKAESTNILKYE
jgi:hypothetical protein